MRYRGTAQNWQTTTSRCIREEIAFATPFLSEGCWCFFFYINTRPQTARGGEEENDRKCPSNSSVRTRSSPSLPLPCLRALWRKAIFIFCSQDSCHLMQLGCKLCAETEPIPVANDVQYLSVESSRQSIRRRHAR